MEEVNRWPNDLGVASIFYSHTAAAPHAGGSSTRVFMNDVKKTQELGDSHSIGEAYRISPFKKVEEIVVGINRNSSFEWIINNVDRFVEVYRLEIERACKKFGDFIRKSTINEFQRMGMSYMPSMKRNVTTATAVALTYRMFEENGIDCKGDKMTDILAAIGQLFGMAEQGANIMVPVIDHRRSGNKKKENDDSSSEEEDSDDEVEEEVGKEKGKTKVDPKIGFKEMRGQAFIEEFYGAMAMAIKQGERTKAEPRAIYVMPFISRVATLLSNKLAWFLNDELPGTLITEGGENKRKAVQNMTLDLRSEIMEIERRKAMKPDKFKMKRVRRIRWIGNLRSHHRTSFIEDTKYAVTSDFKSWNLTITPEVLAVIAIRSIRAVSVGDEEESAEFVKGVTALVCGVQAYFKRKYVETGRGIHVQNETGISGSVEIGEETDLEKLDSKMREIVETAQREGRFKGKKFVETTCMMMGMQNEMSTLAQLIPLTNSGEKVNGASDDFVLMGTVKGPDELKSKFKEIRRRVKGFGPVVHPVKTIISMVPRGYTVKDAPVELNSLFFQNGKVVSNPGPEASLGVAAGTGPYNDIKISRMQFKEAIMRGDVTRGAGMLAFRASLRTLRGMYGCRTINDLPNPIKGTREEFLDLGGLRKNGLICTGAISPFSLTTMEIDEIDLREASPGGLRMNKEILERIITPLGPGREGGKRDAWRISQKAGLFYEPGDYSTNNYSATFRENATAVQTEMKSVVDFAKEAEQVYESLSSCIPTEIIGVRNKARGKIKDVVGTILSAEMERVKSLGEEEDIEEMMEAFESAYNGDERMGKSEVKKLRDELGLRVY